MRQVAWLLVCLVAACRFDLPRLSGVDAPDDDSPSDVLNVDGPPQPLHDPNCVGLPATCGASGNANCCERAMTVQGGSFYRSYDGIGNYNMGYPAMVSSFVLDKYEVTVGRFRAFVNAGKGTQASPPVPGSGVHPNLAGSGWNSAWTASLATNTTALVSIIGCGSWTAEPGANENKPMNCVTSYEAMAFCIWDGGYLPTEAEWNYAASGGDEQRAYPWSNPATSTLIDCSYANYNLSAGTYCVNGMIGAVNRVATESPKGDGRWEHADLAGNVWEWTLDWHADPYPTSTCNDCANLTESIYRVIRGGSFINDAPQLRTANRAFVYPFDHNAHVGLRCARAL